MFFNHFFSILGVPPAASWVWGGSSEDPRWGQRGRNRPPTNQTSQQQQWLGHEESDECRTREPRVEAFEWTLTRHSDCSTRCSFIGDGALEVEYLLWVQPIQGMVRTAKQRPFMMGPP